MDTGSSCLSLPADLFYGLFRWISPALRECSFDLDGGDPDLDGGDPALAESSVATPSTSLCRVATFSDKCDESRWRADGERGTAGLDEPLRNSRGLLLCRGEWLSSARPLQGSAGIR